MIVFWSLVPNAQLHISLVEKPARDRDRASHVPNGTIGWPSAKRRAPQHEPRSVHRILEQGNLETRTGRRTFCSDDERSWSVIVFLHGIALLHPLRVIKKQEITRTKMLN